jgi:hypothetical protein
VYQLFAPVRESLSSRGEEEINEGISEAIDALRNGRRPRFCPAPNPEDVEAGLSAVGSWPDVDSEELKRNLREGRQRGSRPMKSPKRKSRDS